MKTPSADIAHKPFVPFVLLAGLWVIYGLVVVPTWGWTYWDFGDGNYMYIARRVREGLVLYRDILAPQPPLHTLAGVVAQSLGKALFGNELYGVRAYCLLARYAGSLFVMLAALRLFHCPFRGIMAAAVYLTMPIGFWWSLGYQSENLEIIFLVAAIWLILSWDKNQIAIAGICGALACHTNMTGAPFLLANLVFLLFRRRGLALWYVVPAAIVYIVIAIGTNIWTDGYFVSNVLLNQAGTFPRTDILSASPGPPDTFLGYAWGKITSQGWEVIALEAGFLIAAFAGCLYEIAHAPKHGEIEDDKARASWHRVEFMAWQLVAGLLSICFTAKGGTVNYIFVLGEPMVAIFAASAFVALFRKSLPRTGETWKFNPLADTRILLRVVFPLLIVGVIYWPAVRNIRLSLHEVQAELPERQVMDMRLFIETYAEPGDTILAPPFYAYLTGTNVAGELAENYIWNIKYMNETFDAANYGKATADGVAKMDEVAGLLRQGKVAVILLDLAQTGQVPAIREAIEEHYHLAELGPYRTRNTRLGLYIRKDVSPHHIPLR